MVKKVIDYRITQRFKKDYKVLPKEIQESFEITQSVKVTSEPKVRGLLKFGGFIPPCPHFGSFCGSSFLSWYLSLLKISFSFIF